ncbi:MAG: UDP-N-acetylenolpyruvoylglucosamine reductase [Gammaproteobacteria bacterium]|nr:MAG: UDP-N-acetylenolpyruvoylglucosamine reductase [Gammaproteobacteria bacterium]
MIMRLDTFAGELKCNEPLAKHTSWRVGGIAQQLYRPASIEDLAGFLTQLPEDEPVLWLGLGSNLLVRDGGFAGTVISTSGTLKEFEFNGQELMVEVGVHCGKLARRIAKEGLTGGAFLAGIPGTIGGALAMNAGAHKSDTWSLVKEVTTIDRSGTLRTRPTSDFTVGYRHVVVPNGEWFVSATLSFEQGDAAEEALQIKSLLKRRNETQPTTQPCAGSVFRNPQGDFAGRLIEQGGFKGLKVGGASVSEKHANFIVNDGSATASDIEALILLLQQKVELKYGLKLIPEVHIIGEVA